MSEKRALAGQTFEVTAQTGLPGLVGTIGVRIDDTPSGPTVVARTTAGIVERPADSGLYAATLIAPADPGEYSIIWDTGGDEPGYGREDMTVIAGPVEWPQELLDWTPSLEELGTFTRARTKNGYGKYIGTFLPYDDDDVQANTPLSDVEASHLVAEAVSEVASVIGTEIPDFAPDDENADHNMLRKSARSLATLLAAMNVESTLAPEAISDAQGAYGAWERRFNRQIKVLQVAVDEARGQMHTGDDSSSTLETMPGPVFSFPEDEEVRW